MVRLMISSRCIICGAVFQKYRSVNKQTCGKKECVAELKSRHSLPREGTCSDCGKVGKLSKVGKLDGETLCYRCHDIKVNPPTACRFCGHIKRLHGRGACLRCYFKEDLNENKVVCLKCGKTRGHYAKGLCWRCYNAALNKNWNRKRKLAG